MTEQEEAIQEEYFQVYKGVSQGVITFTAFIEWIEQERGHSYTNGYLAGLQIHGS